MFYMLGIGWIQLDSRLCSVGPCIWGNQGRQGEQPNGSQAHQDIRCIHPQASQCPSCCCRQVSCIPCQISSTVELWLLLFSLPGAQDFPHITYMTMCQIPGELCPSLPSLHYPQQQQGLTLDLNIGGFCFNANFVVTIR